MNFGKRPFYLYSVTMKVCQKQVDLDLGFPLGSGGVPMSIVSRKSFSCYVCIQVFFNKKIIQQLFFAGWMKSPFIMGKCWPD